VTFDVNTLWPYELRKGPSDSPENGACTMDAVSWFATGKLGDHPECACPVLAMYVIAGQDAMPDEIRQSLKPFIFRLIGSRDDEAIGVRTRYLALASVRIFAPLALDSCGLKSEAAKLRSLPDDVSWAVAKAAANFAANFAAYQAAYAAKASANSAVRAAYAAGYSAAYSANTAVHAVHASAKAAAKNAAYAANSASYAVHASTYAANSAVHAANSAIGYSAAEAAVWQLYITVLDGALKLGKEGDFDFDLVPLRLREFADARKVRELA
jgi:hypothetical protein